MRNKIFAVAAIVCVVALLACGSLAYFSATDEKSNRFMVASYDPSNPPEPNEVFSVTVTETESPDGTTEDGGNLYKDFLPGDEFTKDPLVTNSGMYDQYVRMTVVFTHYAAWHTLLGEADIFDTLVTEKCENFDTVWDKKTPAVDATEDTITYTFYYAEDDGVLGAGDSAYLFKKVTVPTALEVEDLADLAEFSIIVKADAIQAANTGDSAEDTFTNASYWTEPTAPTSL